MEDLGALLREDRVLYFHRIGTDKRGETLLSVTYRTEAGGRGSMVVPAPEYEKSFKEAKEKEIKI